MTAPWVDVIIVNYRSAKLVRSALGRLRVQGRWPYGRIWVVDNSDDAGHAQELQTVIRDAGGALGGSAWTAAQAPGSDLSPDLVQLTPGFNAGFGAGCNAAWAQSQAPFVLLLNPDAQIECQQLEHLAKLLMSHPQMAAISPRIWWDRVGGWLLPPATPQHPWAQFQRGWASRRDAVAWASAQARRTTQLSASHAADAPLWDVPMLSGAVLLLRRDAVVASGGLFDESFFMYFEDAELCDRLRGFGWRLGIAAQVDAVHSWRHEPHKAPLMASAKGQYRSRQGRLSQWLMRAWPALTDMGELGPVAHRLNSSAQAADALGPVCALSPVPGGDPAWVRSGGAWACLNQQDWDLLAPGHYWAWTQRGWAGFTRH